MKKIVLIAFIGLLAIGALAQKVTIFEVPHTNKELDCNPSIAANRQGDILVCYVNWYKGAMYYFRKHDTSEWVGPAWIPSQPYGEGWGDSMGYTDIVATQNGKFHVVWQIRNAPRFCGLHYAIFDPETQQWSEYQHILDTLGSIEKWSLLLNPKFDLPVLAFGWNVTGGKDMFIMDKGPDGWSKPYDIHVGQYAQTEPGVCFDDLGRTLYSYKADRLIAGGDKDNEEDWDLLVRIQLHDTANGYKYIWGDELTWEYRGWNFLPQVALIKNKGYVTFCWHQRFYYYYIPIEVSGNKILFSATDLLDWKIAPFPVSPHYMFFSMLYSFVDEFVFIYKDAWHFIDLIHCRNNVWDKEHPISLTGGSATTSQWAFDSFVEPSLGILTAWSTTERSVKFSIYDYTKIVIQPPVNAKLEHKMERSYFKQYYMNVLTWENNPYNPEKKINVVKYDIYRKAKGDSRYGKIFFVPSTTLRYVDDVDIGKVNLYDYAIVAVDDQGNESIITEIH